MKRTMAPTRPAIVGKPGCVRFSAWIWIFSSQFDPNARSGGFLPTSGAGR